MRQLASPISHLIWKGDLDGVVAVASSFEATAVAADSCFRAAAAPAGSSFKAASRLVAAVPLISVAAFWTRFAIVPPDMDGFAAIASADRASFRG